MIDWNNCMREVWVNILANQQQYKISAKGMVVDIDESLFTSHKNNARCILSQQWVLGGICCVRNDCFIVQVLNHSAATFLVAIMENIAEGSIIYSNSWLGYKTTKLEEADFQHFKVNHRYNFIDEEPLLFFLFLFFVFQLGGCIFLESVILTYFKGYTFLKRLKSHFGKRCPHFFLTKNPICITFSRYFFNYLKFKLYVFFMSL